MRPRRLSMESNHTWRCKRRTRYEPSSRPRVQWLYLIRVSASAVSRAGSGLDESQAVKDSRGSPAPHALTSHEHKPQSNATSSFGEATDEPQRRCELASSA